MSVAGAPQRVYLVATNPALTRCSLCGGQHEFWSVNHVPIVVDDPAEFVKSPDVAAFVPVEYQPGKHLRWGDYQRLIRGET